MPAANPNKPGGQRRAVKVAKPPPAPKSEAAAAGGYGLGKANQAKRTRAYRGASRVGYAAGSLSSRRAVLANPRPSTAKIVAQRTHATREAVHAKQGVLGGIHVTNGKTQANLGKSTGGGPLAFASPTLSTVKLLLGLKRPNLNVNTGPVGAEAAKIAKNAAKDAINIPAETPASLYKLGKDAVAQAKAEIGGQHGLGKGQTATPFTHDLAEPYVQLVKHPLKSIEAHPLGSALLVAGPLRGAGRAVGSAARGVGIKAASTARESATVPGTELAMPRHYAKGLATKGVQVAVERRKLRKVAALEQEAKTAEEAGQSKQAAELRRQAVRKNPKILKPRQQKALATGLEGMNIAVQRAGKAKAPAAVAHALKGRTEATSLIAQGVATPSRDSIREYVKLLDEQHASGDLSAGEKVVNRATAEKLTKLAASKKLDLAKEHAAAVLIRNHLNGLQEKLAAAEILPAAQAERAALIPHAVTKMGAERGKLPKAERTAAKENLAAVQGRVAAATTAADLKALRPELRRAKGAVKATKGKRIVSAAGERLPNEEIAASMKEGGYVHPPAFVSHRPNASGSQGRFMAAFPMKTLAKKPRTGESIRAGTTDLTPGAIVAQAQRAQSLLDAHNGFKRIIQTAGYREAKGAPPKVYGAAKAAKAAEDLTAETGTKWVAVSVNPWGARHAEIRDIVEGHAPEDQATQTVHETLGDALKGVGPGKKVLLPQHVVDELNAHQSVLNSGPLSKTLRTYSQAWKRSVLAFSPKWLAGNTFEGVGRTAVAGGTPRSGMFAHDVLKAMAEQDAEVARALRTQMVPGGHIGSAHRTLIQPGTAAKAIGQLPVAKQAAFVWRHYTTFVFNDVNGKLIEDPLQMAIAGKVIKRRLRELEMPTHGPKAIEQAVNLLKNTSEQLALGRELRNAYGRYESFGPKFREAVMRYTPFLPWFVNAVKFMGYVLPKDHPILTGLIADAHLASEQWRKQHGFDLWTKGARPGFLQGGIPGVGDSTLRIARYTPFGALSEKEQGLPQYLLPQASGFVQALEGKNFLGNKTTDPVQRWAQAFSFIPLAGPVTNIATGKGPVLTRVRKQFDPLMYTQGKQKTTGAGSRSSTPSLPKLPALPSLQLPKLPGG